MFLLKFFILDFNKPFKSFDRTTLFKEVQYKNLGKIIANHNINVFTFRYYIENRKNIYMTANLEVPEDIEKEVLEYIEVSLSDETIAALQRAEDYAESYKPMQKQESCAEAGYR